MRKENNTIPLYFFSDFLLLSEGLLELLSEIYELTLIPARSRVMICNALISTCKVLLPLLERDVPSRSIHAG
jgi:hypothetical protein